MLLKMLFTFGVKVTGIPCILVNEDYDKGPIIAQRAVEIREDDTLESLETRIHEAEHELYPEVLCWLSNECISIRRPARYILIRRPARYLLNLVVVSKKTNIR